MPLLDRIHSRSSFGPPQPHVSVHVYGTRVWMCMCRPEVDITCLSYFLLTVHLRYWCRTSHWNPDLASLASQLSLGVLSLHLRRARVTGSHLCGCWRSKLGPHAWTTNTPLSEHHANSGSSFLFISLWAVPWSFIRLLFQHTLGLPNIGN